MIRYAGNTLKIPLIYKGKNTNSNDFWHTPFVLANGNIIHPSYGINNDTHAGWVISNWSNDCYIINNSGTYIYGSGGTYFGSVQNLIMKSTASNPKNFSVAPHGAVINDLGQINLQTAINTYGFSKVHWNAVATVAGYTNSNVSLGYKFSSDANVSSVLLSFVYDTNLFGGNGDIALTLDRGNYLTLVVMLNALSMGGRHYLPSFCMSLTLT